MTERAAKPPPVQRPQAPSSPLVIAADIVASVAVTLFATNMLRPGVPITSVLLVIAFAALPRIAAEKIQRPRSLFKSRGLLIKARLVAVLAVLAGLTVARFALAAIPSMGRASGAEMFLVVGVWAAGFALRDHGAYRVYEPLCCASLVASVLRNCAQPIPLISAAFLALGFSAALRHQIGHVAVSRRVRKLRVRNAAVAALVLTLAILAIFTGASAGLGSVLKPSPADETRHLRPGNSGKRPELERGPGNPNRRTSVDADPSPAETDTGAGGKKREPRNFDYGDDRSVPDTEASKPFDMPLLVVLTAAGLIVTVFLIMRSWRRTPPKEEEPDDEEEEAPAVVTAPAGRSSFVPRTPAEHLLVDYSRLQEDLSTSGQERRSWETPREHGLRVSPESKDPANAAFESLVPLVDDGLYGKADLTDGDVSKGRGAMHVIKKELG